MVITFTVLSCLDSPPALATRPWHGGVGHPTRRCGFGQVVCDIRSNRSLERLGDRQWQPRSRLTEDTMEDRGTAAASSRQTKPGFLLSLGTLMRLFRSTARGTDPSAYQTNV